MLAMLAQVSMVTIVSGNGQQDASNTSLANLESNRNLLFIFCFNLRPGSITFEINSGAANVAPPKLLRFVPDLRQNDLNCFFGRPGTRSLFLAIEIHKELGSHQGIRQLVN